jgi:DNA invertase Pin-like site-specific DNA recombinase
MPAMRCACYARFSTDLQRATSLEDQIAIARRYAEAQGWYFATDHVYTDAAISGASLERPGISALRTAATHRPLPFDVLLVDDSSRVSRDLADAVRLLQELRFCGVRVIYISQNIDSASEQAETLVAVHGVVDSLYLREMAKKIKRGLAGQLERGFATGAITFGYRTVPVPDPSGKTDVNGYPVLLGKRVEVVPEEARIIVQIFEWAASGLGTFRLVERLKREGLQGPRGGRWRDGAVKRVLANEKYRGFLIWGKTTQERRPGTRQYVERPVPREQWRTLERPDLRIVSEELWARVAARRQLVRDGLPVETGRTLMRGRNAVLHSPHLFSGFMKCGTCSGAVVVVTGGYGSPRYGCQRSWRNGVDSCPNRLTIRAKVADAYLLEGLQAELAAPATLKYVVDALASALNQRIDERPRLMAEAQTARDQARLRLHRLIDAIEHGVAASTLATPIAERQAEIARLEATLADLAEPLQQRLAVMPAWVQQQLEDLAGLFRDSPERTKTEFQRLGLAVTMTPTLGQNSRPFYRADVVNSLPCLAGITEMREFSPSSVDRWDQPGAGSRTGQLRFRVDLPANQLGPGWKKRA